VTAENTGLMSSEPEKTFHEMMVAIEDGQSDIPCSDTEEDGDDVDDE
jgi:hypothetical protein